MICKKLWLHANEKDVCCTYIVINSLFLFVKESIDNAYLFQIVELRNTIFIVDNAYLFQIVEIRKTLFFLINCIVQMYCNKSLNIFCC